ncbi:hypothetical protein WT09_30265 [Burkholderia stagnalis]|nr:hypothetical protein WT09_30265 [Burkholderia stagnalis]
MTSTRLMIHSIMPERSVNCGFNWWALIFSTMWAYSEGLIVQGGRLFAADAVAGLLLTRDHVAFVILALLLLTVKSVYCARHRNRWVYQHLHHQGYRTVGD